MSDMQYAYAVARIRAKELSLLNAQALEQLLAAKTEKECLSMLQSRGWGGAKNEDGAEQMLEEERKKTWELLKELLKDLSAFTVFLLPNDYHNLKAAIKAVYSDSKPERIFADGGTVDPGTILRAFREHDYSLLPEPMRAPAREAFETLLHTGDGQLCDFILDRASLLAVYRAGEASENELIRKYAELTVAAADIKIAVRACATGKPVQVILRALAPCGSIHVKELAQAAAQNQEKIYEYLRSTEYADAEEPLRESLSAFERWCDNRIMRAVRPQKYNPLTIGPLAAYLIARENEIRAVRMILSGKRNHLPEQSVRERLRETYV
ncbi:MAG: V-type ATPase subunit [Clostridiales bacterium]|jgi:V/A-type H+-transporting ATPase subunit C|nr:V-type ATPase subunit [Clostridiales bacterium]